LCKYLDPVYAYPFRKKNILFQSSGKITVKEMPVVLSNFAIWIASVLLKETIGILWKAFEGILNDRAENPAIQHSKLLKFLWCWRRNMFLYTI
jgi:hypothetical protein